VSTHAYCSGCGAELRADDRFCSRCGGVGNAADPSGVHVQEFVSRQGARQRLGDFALDHAKGLLVLVAVGALVGIGALLDREKSVPEDASSPGYEMVRALRSSSAIDSFKAVAPEQGWDSEYSINDGDAHVRFRGTSMEVVVDNYDNDLRDAIDAEARSEGFTG
jgi:hypothetical protein